MKIEVNEDLELLVELLEGATQAEGYKTKRYSETSIFNTSAYDCLILRDSNGREYTLTISERTIYNEKLGKHESTNDLE